MENPVFDNARSLLAITPEIALVAGIVLVIVLDLLVRGRQKMYVMAAVALAVLAYSVVRGGIYPAALTLANGQGTTRYEAFATATCEVNCQGGGLLVADQLVYLSRVFFGLVTGLVVILSIPNEQGKLVFGRGRGDAQFFTLLLTISLGMNLMAGANNLLMIYLSLEMVSVISFVLAGFKLDDRRSWEGALKYVIFGGVSSGIMLYGMSWIFGLTQSLHLPTIAAKVSELTAANGGKVPDAILIGVVCMMAGFGYKISAAPFHMWAPDVYEGSPTQVTMFFSVGPKAAGFVVMMRFFDQGLNAGSGPGSATWKILAGVIAMATMTIGNLSALNQPSVKRMLAFSSIAHAGYMMLGFSVFSAPGDMSVLFYLLVYYAMNFGAFLVQMAVAEKTGTENIEGFKGLGARAPGLAIAMTMFLFSLAGIPPLAGFVGKFYIFMALVNAGGAWAWTLAVVGVVNSVISVFYYARVAKAMWLEKADSEASAPVQVRTLYGATAGLLAVPTLILGLYWAPVYDWVAKVLQ